MIAVVGIHLHCRDRIQLVDGVKSHHAIALVEVFTLRRCTTIETTKQTGGRRVDGIATKVVKHVCPSKIFVVAAFQRTDGLELVSEHHACHAQEKPHPLPLSDRRGA